jgi:hypothetical protein
MAYVWLGKSAEFPCDAGCANGQVGTGRTDKWGEEITVNCQKCGGTNTITKTWKEREWVDDPPEEEKKK